MSDTNAVTVNKGPRKREEIAFHLRATCTVAQACAGTGLGRTLLYELMGEKIIESTTVKRRRLINVPSLLRAVGYRSPLEQGAVH